MDFSQYGKSDIEKKIDANYATVKDDLELNDKFYEGDHYQEGQGWRGALPTDASDRGKTLEKIKALFSSQNVIKEVSNRLIGAVIGKDPEWNIHLTRPMKEEDKPTDQEIKNIDESEQALNEWWKTYKLHSELEDYLTMLLLGKKAVLRIYVPSKFIENGVIENDSDLLVQLNKIRVEAISPEKATVFTDSITGDTAGMLSYKPEEGEPVVEICWIDEKGLTVLKKIVGENEETSDPINLDGNLLMYEADVDLFITEQIRQLQMIVNKSVTMLNSNLDAGFLERIFTNAMPNGRWETNEEGVEIFIPGPMSIGVNTTNFLNGIETIDEDGKVKITTPGVHFREPTPNDTYVTAKAIAYTSILEEVQQKHALISGDAAASGESRIQALVDFISSCQTYKAAIEEAGIWLLETVLNFGFAISGREKDIGLYSADFRCRLDTGYLPAEMRKQIIEEYKDGMLSRETAMSMLGVDDVDAEISRIDSATADVKEIFDILNAAGVKPKTIVVELINKMIADKAILADLEADKAKREALKGEIESILAANTQELDFMSQLGL